MALTSLYQSVHVVANISFLLSTILYFSFTISPPPPTVHICNPPTEITLKTNYTNGYIDYLNLFYCAFCDHHILGYTFLTLWLIVLFYLLANTASQYFCTSLESLSNGLNLSPAVAGVTLLSLGNGAPDVFASVISFTTAGGGGEVGLSSVLGGAFFVSSAVLGVIGVSARNSVGAINRASFTRDLCFLLFVFFCILVILTVGKIHFFGAVAFASLYVVYVAVVFFSHCCNNELNSPLLESVETGEKTQPSVEFDSKLDILSTETTASSVSQKSWLFYLIELPLYLPRRLTIPVVTQEKWSKQFTVYSVMFSPMLLAVLWYSKTQNVDTVILFFFAILLGVVLGVATICCTEETHPPKKFKFPLLAGGFLMSVVWTYMTAGELVALLVSIARILGVRPSVIGVTVLAWGNSIGDLLANVSMAVNGGGDGAQVAVAGCYAGPIFNTLVGLGISFVLCSWKTYPFSFVIVREEEQSEFMLIACAVGGLLWALLMLSRKGMMIDRGFGIGLLAIYACFLCMRILESLHVL